MTNIIIGLAPSIKNKIRVGYDWIGIIANCPNSEDIYLLGNMEKFESWLNTIIHEEHHRVLHKLGIPVEHHHPIMEKIGVS